MAVVSMKQLLEAGVHFGHQTRRWNPKMAKYIFTERNGIYIIDLQKTVKKLDESYNFVRDVAADGGEILFVGTKKQAQESIRDEATRCGMHYVNARWLGGMMTNFRTIRKRIDRMDQLAKMKENGTFELLPKKEGPSRGESWMQFKVGYYLFAILYLMFDVETVFLFPWAVILKDLGVAGLFNILFFMVILVLGLVYAWKKGALEWK